MIRKYWVYALFIFAVAFFICRRYIFKPRNPDHIELTVKTFKTDLGWGYDIYTNDSVFIHQDLMPAVEGRKGFATEEDAKKIADLSVSKMKKGGKPMILLSDLDSCKIQR